MVKLKNIIYIKFKYNIYIYRLTIYKPDYQEIDDMK